MASSAISTAAVPLDRNVLLQRFFEVREASLRMCEPLEPEDFRIQPMAEASPPWWNLGHTSWFFVRNLLGAFGGELTPEDRDYDFVLNSYYVSLGPRVERPRRGLLTRPTTEEIYQYRASVDRRVGRLLRDVDEQRLPEVAAVLTIGLQHEQQHQELFYTEIKNILWQNPAPLRPAYREVPPAGIASPPAPAEFIAFPPGLVEIGNVEGGWCWDNELPVHTYYLPGFAIQDRLVTTAEFLEFIDDGGYRDPLLWLDNGWHAVEQSGWQSPLYWERSGRKWSIYTLSGSRPLDPHEPVCHVSFYEADAFARWKAANFSDCRGVRLPTEREWEHCARSMSLAPEQGFFVDSGNLHPRPAPPGQSPAQMLGDVWEWTASYYEGYPGYRPFSGPLSEYNGKFMDNQRVLRGGSCVTERNHLRISYRNFWPADTRFQFTGIRLARDVDSL